MNITSDAIRDLRDPHLGQYWLHGKDMAHFQVWSVDDDGKGGYAKGDKPHSSILRWDLTGTKLTRHNGYRVRITVMVDTGDMAGTLSPTGESWTGGEVPAALFSRNTDRKARHGYY